MGATEPHGSVYPPPATVASCFGDAVRHRQISMMTLRNVGMVGMGEAKRRKAAQRQPVVSEGLSFAEIERLMGEDPDDRAIREAHGFAYEDDFEDRSLLCRNGCGLSYFEVAVGKIRRCARR